MRFFHDIYETFPAGLCHTNLSRHIRSGEVIFAFFNGGYLVFQAWYFLSELLARVDDLFHRVDVLLKMALYCPQGSGTLRQQ